MLAMIISQYVKQEKKDTLYVLRNDNEKMEETIQYLEEIVLSIRNSRGLQSFFEYEFFAKETAIRQLERSVDLFSERNRLDILEPFIEKIYLYNKFGDSIDYSYYPTTVYASGQSRKRYDELYKNFKNSEEDFYLQVDDDYLNLCMQMYDTELNFLGDCIFALNRSGIESNYKNLEEMRYYRWHLSQKEGIILGKETISEERQEYLLENKIQTGFGLTLYAAVSKRIIYQQAGKTIAIVLLISFVLVLMLSLFGRAIALHYAKPLRTIAEKIQLVGKGNFDTKLEEYKAVELKNISHTFNEMTDYINHLIEKVYETQIAAQQSQIQYLQSQMNPHFLFNVLSMIEMKAALNQDKEVQEMLYKLSKLYQGKIFRKNEYFITLEEEMEIVDFYLFLQNSRFGSKITYQITYRGDKEKYHRDMVPRLSIEPIVENAVCHGLEPKEDNGHIFVTVFEEEDKLIIKVEDDGVGFETGEVTEKKADRSHTHMGLMNTDKMIRQLCGKEYGLEIQSEIGKGTAVRIVLPIRSEDAYVQSNDG